MKEKMIRNIGEEFWSDWISQPASADCHEMRVLYKVVEIVKVYEFGNFGPMIDAERVEVIKVERRLPISSSYLFGLKNG